VINENNNNVLSTYHPIVILTESVAMVTSHSNGTLIFPSIFLVDSALLEM